MKRKVMGEDRRRRLRRAAAIRRKLIGTSSRPRLSVFKSAKHIYAQVVDDIARRTLAAASSAEKSAVEGFGSLKKSEMAEKIGALLAERAKAAGLETVVFDRKGWPFHGRIAALAKGAREGGLKF